MGLELGGIAHRVWRIDPLYAGGLVRLEPKDSPRPFVDRHLLITVFVGNSLFFKAPPPGCISQLTPGSTSHSPYAKFSAGSPIAILPEDFPPDNFEN